MRWSGRRAVTAAVVLGLAMAGVGGCEQRSATGVAVAVSPGSPQPDASSRADASSADASAPAGGTGPAGERRSGQPAVDPSGSAGPGAVLAAAVAAVEGQNLVFTLGDGVARADGRYDASTGGAVLSRVTDGRRVEVTVLGGEMYLSGFSPGGVVLRLLTEHLAGGSSLLPVATPLLGLRLLAGAGHVELGAEGFTGRIDLTAVDPGQSLATGNLLRYLVQQAGDRATQISFTATVDGVGRLTGFRTVLPRADAGRDLAYELAIVQVGIGVTITRPAGAVIDAPAGGYTR